MGCGSSRTHTTRRLSWSTRDARLTEHGRRLSVERVLHQGRRGSHVATEMGVSRQCASHWMRRYDAGLTDRSSRPRSGPTRTPAEVEAQILALRSEHRRGRGRISAELGVPARTVSRVLRRYRVPYLRELDPLTGAVIRASKTTAVRYERDRPGELVHMDVKKIGRIPDGGAGRPTIEPLGNAPTTDLSRSASTTSARGGRAGLGGGCGLCHRGHGRPVLLIGQGGTHQPGERTRQ